MATARVDDGVILDPFPRSQAPTRTLLAPPPSIDKFPFVIGQNLTGQYVSTAYRLCTTGWRYQFVDLINELLENDPHARGATRFRVLSVAGGRVKVNAANLPPNHKDERLANEIAEQFDWQFNTIPALSQALGRINWGLIYGLSGTEVDWERTDAWEIAGLSHIHSRRLNYSDSASWDLYIYDQGLVGPGIDFGRTNSLNGLRVADYPAKFIIHAPALNADYPTRDGEARYIGMYMLMKRMVVRATAQDFERTIRPWVIGYFSRQLDQKAGKPFATQEDIEKLEAAIAALGAGSLNAATLSEACRIEILRAASSMDASAFLTFLNQEISKSLLGQAFTTEPGANGNFSTAETANKNTLKICQYDASCCADTLRRDLATPWMRLNYPQADRRLVPRISIEVDELPDAATVMKLAAQGASIDMPIDVDKLSEKMPFELVPPEDDEQTPRRTRMVAAGRAESPPPDGAPSIEIPGAAAPKNGAAAKPNGKANGQLPNGKGKQVPIADEPRGSS